MQHACNLEFFKVMENDINNNDSDDHWEQIPRYYVG